MGLKRTRSQRGALSCRNGTWSLRWRSEPDEHGRRRSRCCRVGSSSELRSRAAARLAADRLLVRMGLGQVLSGKAIRFGDFVKEHAPGLLSTYSRATANSYRSILRRHLVPSLGGKLLHEITAGVVGRYVTDAAGKGATRAQLLTHVSVIRALIEHAIGNGCAAVSFSRRSVRLPPKAVAQPRPYFSPADCGRIIEGAEWPWRAFFALGALLGLRSAEAAALEWSHLDLERGVVTLRQASSHGQIKVMKSARSATELPVSAELTRILEAFRAWRRAQLGGHEPTGLLFPAPSGRPRWLSGVLRTHWHPLLERLGLPSAGLHSLRHSYCAGLFASGASAPTVQALMRHSSLQTTASYAHVIATDLRQAADRAAQATASSSVSCAQTRASEIAAP